MGQTKIKTIEELEEIQAGGPEERSQASTAANEVSEDAPEIPKGQDPQSKKVKKSRKPGKARGRGKKYQEAVKLVDRTKKYPLEEAVKIAQQASYSKFPGTLEAHINTAAKNIRGLISMPHLSGRSLKVLAFGRGAKEAGADIEGTEDTISEIEKGKLGFDVLVTTPEWMPKLAKTAKILGPRGLMPNPKNGTITENLEKTITDLKGGKIEYKSEPNGQVIHLPIGKTIQAAEEITANIKVLYGAIGKSKVKKITISPTMGPGVRIDLRSI